MKLRKIFLIILAVVVLVAGTSAIIAYSMWDRPLGPSLQLPTYTAPNLPAGSTEQAAISQVEGTALPNTVITYTRATNPVPLGADPLATEPPPLCGGPKSMTILAIGTDQTGENYAYGLADSIHVAYVDFVTPKIMVVDFPRDTWVEIPEISDHYGITHGKLNQAYFFGNPGMGYYDGPGEGPGLMARTLDLNFGMRVDHYVAIDMDAFVDMIDAVGGIDVVIDEPTDLSYGFSNPTPDMFLSVGVHHLDGEHALVLSRNRIPSTFQRMKYQKIVLKGLREKLLSPDILPIVPKLVTRFIPAVQTDLSPQMINSLICLAQAVPDENILAESFPREIFTAESIYDPYRQVYTFVYLTDFDKIRLMVGDFMNGIWPFKNK